LYPAQKNLRDAGLSSAGQWRSCSKVPNLRPCVETGAHSGRIKIEGKIFRSSLKAHLAGRRAALRQAAAALRQGDGERL